MLCCPSLTRCFHNSDCSHYTSRRSAVAVNVPGMEQIKSRSSLACTTWFIPLAFSPPDITRQSMSSTCDCWLSVLYVEAGGLRAFSASSIDYLGRAVMWKKWKKNKQSKPLKNPFSWKCITIFVRKTKSVLLRIAFLWRKICMPLWEVRTTLVCFGRKNLYWRT